MRNRNSFPRVVFFGTHGQRNIGDELLLEVFLDQLGPDAHYVINTYDVEFTERQLRDRFSVDLIDTAGDRFKLARHLLSADCVIFGGGSIVKELYATTGRNRYATLLMLLSIVVFARWIARRPVAMLNIGVGPIPTRTGRMLARLILRHADKVIVRDPGSLMVCRSLGIREDSLHLGTDAVFSVGPEWLLGESAPKPPEGDRLRIALNLNRDIENPENWEHFTINLAEALRRLAASRPVEIHALPMQSHFKEHDDATMLREFARLLPGVPFIQHELVDHRDAATVISRCDVVMSERLHAIVMASILRVPSFVLAYDVKVRQLSSLLGLDDYTVDVNEPFSPEAIEEPLTHMIDNLTAVDEQVAFHTSELGRRAQDDFARARLWMAEAAAR